MKHIIISDTHSPTTTQKAYEHVRDELLTKTNADAIVINGDLLGVFSLRSCNTHKRNPMTQQDKMNYLQLCAPNFYALWSQTQQITPEMVIDYVQERYDWAYESIAQFAKLKKTYFNLGNHESRYHFLVLQEIPFLTGCHPSVIQNVNQDALENIYEHFETQLYALEKALDFKYIRDTHDIVDGILIMGIPGESHGTVGPDYEAQVQEQKTQQLIQQVSQDLDKVHTIIIYNHTQADYDRATGSFHAASPSLKQFMANLPANVSQRIFVQSHNHWSYTQFLQAHGFKFILNNAGLHDGIFNFISFDQHSVNCFDICPNTKSAIKLTLSTQHHPIESDMKLISRFYKNYVDIYMHRRLLV